MIGTYIGAAIDTANGDASAPFKRITDLLDEVVPNYIVFNPLTAYGNATKGDAFAEEYLVDVNMFAMKRADLAVFLVNDSPSIGVPVEIHTCVQENKKFVVLYDATKNPGVYLKYLCRVGKGQLIDLRESKSVTPAMQLRSILANWEMI